MFVFCRLILTVLWAVSSNVLISLEWLLCNNLVNVVSFGERVEMLLLRRILKIKHSTWSWESLTPESNNSRLTRCRQPPSPPQRHTTTAAPAQPQLNILSQIHSPLNSDPDSTFKLGSWLKGWSYRLLSCPRPPGIEPRSKKQTATRRHGRCHFGSNGIPRERASQR